MDTNEREKTLLEVIRQGLEFADLNNTKMTLGNRSAYLGLSDLAQYSKCPRKAILDKISFPQNSLERILTLQRGHWFENGMKECMTSLDMRFMHQLEISHVIKGVQIKAHLDFTLVWDEPYPAVRILEIKSTEKIPDKAHESHLNQAQAQVNFLYELWEKPVFSIKNCEGEILHEKLAFPQLCKSCFGIKLPEKPGKISVEAWILYLSMKNAKAFGPYAHDRIQLKASFKMAGEFWKKLVCLKNREIDPAALKYARGFYPLCSCCQFNVDCPKFKDGDFQPHWEKLIEHLDDLKKDRSTIDARIKDIESTLKLTHSLHESKEWINTGRHRFRVTNASGRKLLDTDRLREELEEIFLAAQICDIDIKALFGRCIREGEPSSRLTIMPIN